MTDHALYIGHTPDGTAYLLTVFDDGTHTLATRDGYRWGAPVELKPIAAEVCS